MKCPHCNETLVMSERQGIEIDYCPKCRGVWLDKGELDKIIERSQNESSDRTNYRDDDDDDDYQNKQNEQRKDYKQQQPQRKRRGFLGDLFDFD